VVDYQQSTEDRARELVAQAHALFHSERMESAQEVIVTSVLEILSHGPRTNQQIAAEFNRILARC
jgi:hypothetical protein